MNRHDESIFPKAFTVPNYTVEATDQGNRGTCAAFAITALLNYYARIRSQELRFSPQYLYARCKLEALQAYLTEMIPEDSVEQVMDAMAQLGYERSAKMLCDILSLPPDSQEETIVWNSLKEVLVDDGLNLEQAMNCIAEYGVCLYEQWPYSLAQTDTEFQIAPSRIDEIKTIKLSKVPFFQLYSPRNVNEYKGILCGLGGHVPMPIVIGCQIFQMTGIVSNPAACWLREPMPGDTFGGGHAMLVFGYKDTPFNQHSDGYFRVQNSTLLHAPGCKSANEIHIPYEYVEKWAMDAMTIRQKQEKNPQEGIQITSL